MRRTSWRPRWPRSAGKWSGRGDRRPHSLPSQSGHSRSPAELGMKVVRMLAFAPLGALMSAVGGAWACAGRQPIDWSTVSLDVIDGGPMRTADFTGRVVLL